MQTKGEHNPEQLIPGNNAFGINETYITKDQILGEAVFKIPYLGYVKIWASELLSKIIG